MRLTSQKSSTQRMRQLCFAALIAALYVALTYFSMLLGLDKNAVQIRFSEALVVLAFLTPAAIPGLTLGCFLANLLTGCAPLDIVLGPIATLIGATGAYLMGKIRNRVAARWLCTLPNLLANTVIVTLVCYVCYTAPDAQTPEIIPFYAATIAIGEIISCTVIGSAIILPCEKMLKRFL